jgi:4-amino-4-deoxy-L-arabinose transferase-like glycosyltransferase
VEKLFRKLFDWGKENKLLLLLSLFYFIFRLINLTKLPIFNDEAIYLDWGFRETHRAGFLYYSLYDAKQPLLMWIFGIAESIFADPLFAGRLVSVLAGFLTMLGIYKISKEYFAKEVGLIAIFLYAITPLFSFYDRQALMESAVAAVGIWAGYFFLKTLLNPASKKNPVLLGVVLGIGFFIKSSALLFLVSGFLILIVYSIFAKKIRLLNSLVATILAFLIVIFFLLINPQFWQTLPSNSRYSLTLAEILAFPIKIWSNSLIANVQIALVFLTPLILLTSVIGIIYIFWIKQKNQIMFILFFIVSLLGTTMLVRIPSDRYVVSFLPFLLVPTAYLVWVCFKRQKVFGVLLILLVVVVPFALTMLQIFNPPLYLSKTLPYAPSVNASYLSGVTSGYGVNEAVDYFKNVSQNKPIVVGIAENTGNPESALIDYFISSPKVKVVYFAPELLPLQLNSYDCLSINSVFYFAARDEQQIGLEKFLQKIKTIRSPYGKSTIGIYTLKKGCVGKTLVLHINAT